MDDLFSAESFATLSGSVMMVVVVMNTLRHALNWGPKWFGLTLSVGISFLAYLVTSSMTESKEASNLEVLTYAIVVLNGCLIYTSAYGIQNTVIANESAFETQQIIQNEALTQEESKLRFRSKW